MAFQFFFSSVDYFLELIRLSDAAFHNLLGMLLVTVLLRFVPPLYKNITKELENRNEIADLAETDGCTEFEVFVKAFQYYDGMKNQKKVERDFFVYLCNWPDNYILPYYMRLYLNMRKKNGPDSGGGESSAT